jgi:hypothetical protein
MNGAPMSATTEAANFRYPSADELTTQYLDMPRISKTSFGGPARQRKLGEPDRMDLSAC